MITPKGQKLGRPCADCKERIANPSKHLSWCLLCQRNNFLKGIAKAHNMKFVPVTWKDIKW
jgi:hypothetical protein